MWVDAKDVRDFFENEFRRRRYSDRYEIISYDDCLEMLDEALACADTPDEEEDG